MVPVTESNATLAELITAARGGLPMRELARRSGLSAAQISRIEAGNVESPTIETLVGLARGLGRDPQLLLAALGRMEDEEAVALVLRSLPDSGSPAETPSLAKARKELQRVHVEIAGGDAERRSLFHDWQDVVAEHDALKSEADDAEIEVGALEDSVPHAPDPERMAAHLAEAKTRHTAVRLKLDSVARRGTDLRERIDKRQASIAHAEERRAEVVQRAASELFVSGATSPDRELETLLAGTIDIPLSGRSRLLADLVASTSAAQSDAFKRAVAGVLESTARLKADDDALMKHLAETLTESLSKARAELEQAMKQLRNQIVHQTGDTDFRRVTTAWSRLTPERRAKVVEFVEDQRRLSMQEQLYQGPTRREVMEIEQTFARSKRS